METIISSQAAALALAFALGILLGLVYDILRPIRRNCGSLGAAAIDCFFALISAFSIFVYSLGAPSGRLGLWELTASVLGFLGYIYSISDYVYLVTSAVYGVIADLFFQFKKLVCRCVDLCKKRL